VLLACRQKRQQSQRENVLQRSPITRKESFAEVSKNLIKYR